MSAQEQSAREILPNGSRPHEDVLDEVYERYAFSDPFVPMIRFVDHSTMGPEALVGLGRGHRVHGWIDRHPPRRYTAARTGISISQAWTQGGGRRECPGDWLAFFEDELATRSVDDVLLQWVPRFVHAIDALLF